MATMTAQRTTVEIKGVAEKPGDDDLSRRPQDHHKQHGQLT
jgi:hypothetical protein